MSVMVEHINFLNHSHSKEKLSDDLILLLSHTPCIPVYSTYEATHHWQVVLVEPCQVLRQDISNEYHPFLHKLDGTMSTCINLLQNIGVDFPL